jgi:hypothetical protein
VDDCAPLPLKKASSRREFTPSRLFLAQLQLGRFQLSGRWFQHSWSSCCTMPVIARDRRSTRRRFCKCRETGRARRFAGHAALPPVRAETKRGLSRFNLQCHFADAKDQQITATDPKKSARNEIGLFSFRLTQLQDK